MFSHHISYKNGIQMIIGNSSVCQLLNQSKQSCCIKFLENIDINHHNIYKLKFNHSKNIKKQKHFGIRSNICRKICSFVNSMEFYS